MVGNIEPEILAWAKVNYPQLIGNEELIRKLYRKKVLGEKVEATRSNIKKFPLRKISQLENGKPAVLFFVKVEVADRRAVKVCAVCGRKNCNDPAHKGKKDLYILRLEGGDDTGEIKVNILTENELDVAMVEENDVFLIKGTMKNDDKFGREFIARGGVIPLTKEEAEALTDLINLFELYGGAGGLDKSKFDEFVNSHRQLLEKVISNVSFDVVGDKVIW
jgi:hypothetical protein